MTPMTRKMLREAAEDEQAAAAYPPRPARCEARLMQAGPGFARHTRPCKRTARASGLCWQHERSALLHERHESWADGCRECDAEQQAMPAIAERSATR